MSGGLSPRFDAALALAHALHRAQRRKGTDVPYVAHLLAVASLALEHGATEDEAIAALLHDAVEDQGGAATAARIRAEFGEAVVAIVLGCTDTPLDDAAPKPAWRARKEAYVAHLAHAAPSVRLVSTCDKLHNARAIVADLRVHGASLWPRFSGGRDGVCWYYGALVAAFAAAGPVGPYDELARTVAVMHDLAAS